jgi:hypothetical protein
MCSGPPEDPGAFPPIGTGAVGHPGRLAWGATETARGQYDFTYYDAQVDKAASHHQPMYVTFGATPRWAVADTSTCEGNECTDPPQDITDWTDFVKTIVTRYRGKVQYWEIWNEANGHGFWTGTQAELVALAKAAYPIIHAIDPAAIVVAPTASGPMQSATAWLDGYFAAGGAAYADACGAHGYPTQVSPLPFPETEGSNGAILTRLRAFRATCDAHGLAGKPLLMSEGSWGENMYLTDSAEQVAFLARYVLLQAGARAELNLAASYWYAYGYGGPTAFGNIANMDGSPTPAGVAYGEVYGWLAEKALAACVAAADGGYSCVLTDPADASYRGLVVWTTKSSGAFSVAAPYDHVRLLDGTSHQVSPSDFAIGPAPVLFEGHS